MTERDTRVWMPLAVVLGVLMALLNLANLVFVEGDVARDVVAMGLGGLLVVVAVARYRGWRGLRR